MKTFYECRPCLLNQTLATLKRGGAGDEKTRMVMRMVLCELAGIDFALSSPQKTLFIHRTIKWLTKCGQTMSRA